MKKSKFLKKSLAMLLALMLVVAMIPLSASAALPEDLKYIIVNDSQVSVDELEVEMSSSLLTSGSVKISTNEDLAAEGVELRVYEKGGSVEYATAPQYVVSGTTGDEFAIADYVDVSSDKTTGTVKLELVATENNETIADNTVLASYTLNIKFVDANTTTNLAVVPNSDGTFGDGVYNAYVKGDEIIVETARYNPNADTNPWTETTQKGVQAYITVKALDGATLLAPYTGVEDTIKANNGNKVTVKSQDTKHETTYTVKSVYVDALESFTITAGETDYAGQIKDINNDDVVDTIEVVLPKSVLTAANGDPDPSPVLPVSFESKGNINAEVEVAITGGETKNVKTNGSVSVTFNALDQDDVKGTVTVTRLNGFVQQYNLVVKTEDSTNTAIDYARVNATQATIDGNKISAVLPQKYNGKETQRKSVDLVLYTEDTVSKVVIGTTEADPATGEANSSTQKAWKFTGVDTTKAVTIAVYAEDGHFEQYSLTTSMAEQTNTAGMSAIWLGDGTNTYEGKLTGTNEYTITVPYMTTDISSWVVYATPTSGSKVVYNNGGNQTDVINGITKTTAIGLAKDPTLNGIKTTVVALNMADDTIHTDYTVKVVLDSAKSANTLTGLDFTAQLSTNNTDKKVYRALNDENQFHAYVDQQSNGTPDLGNINLYVPASLSTHYEDYDVYTAISYHNVVTDFEVPAGGVAYLVERNNAPSNDWKLVKLASTTNDDSDDPPATGTEIKNGSMIIVLPEQIARQVETGTADSSYASGTQPGWIDQDTAKKHGTVYTVKINVNDYETGSDLKSFSLGDVDLTISGHDIVGKIPWSYTVPSSAISGNTVQEKYMSYAMNAEFVLSPYAALRTDLGNGEGLAMGGTAKYGYPLYSNGDINGDGVADNSESWGGENMKFLFVRNDDHTVTVYRTTWSGKGNAGQVAEITEVTVRAEDRLALRTNGSYPVSHIDYTFELEWADPSKEAEITSFKLANQTGTVTNTSETERTINVNVPYGTDLKGMVATFETSLGATVKIGSTSGMDFISGVTSLNYTSDVVVYVTSEDGSVTNRYTIKVAEGISFSDVNEGAWYYENVMGAAENGYVSGYEDGTFKPTKAITRAEFAAMIANALGYDSNPEEAPSMFPDVANDFWGKAAINFCAQNGILSGYDDGTFQPNKAITRQEAAAILNNAFDLAEKTGISSDKFADDSKIAGWAKDHVYAAKAAGLMKGDAGTGAFRPTDTIIRAEAASILMNANREGLIK